MDSKRLRDDEAAAAAAASPTRTTKRPPRILSIQSFCVHSTVGQKAAMLPLQVAGMEVDPINTVHLSCHKGYAKGATGSAMSAAELATIVSGLEKNGIMAQYTHVLTGYVGSEELLRAVVAEILDRVVSKTSSDQPQTFFLCDPVLGDHGKFYVPESLVNVYATLVIPRAHVVTPNQFEAEALTGIKIASRNDAVRACDALHALGVRLVVITTCNFASDAGTFLVASLAPVSNSTPPPSAPPAKQRRFLVRIPVIPGRWVGTGDLFAALLLGRLVRNPADDDVPSALQFACCAVHAVISRTRNALEDGSNPFGELRVVASLPDLTAPDLSVVAVEEF